MRELPGRGQPPIRVPFTFFARADALPSTLRAVATASYVAEEGASISHCEIRLPLALVCVPVKLPDNKLPVMALQNEEGRGGSGGGGGGSKGDDRGGGGGGCRGGDTPPPATFHVTLEMNRPLAPIASLFRDLLQTASGDATRKAIGGVTPLDPTTLSLRYSCGLEVSVLSFTGEDHAEARGVQGGGGGHRQAERGLGRYRIESSAFEGLAMLSEELLDRLRVFFADGGPAGEAREGIDANFSPTAPLPSLSYPPGSSQPPSLTHPSSPPGHPSSLTHPPSLSHRPSSHAPAFAAHLSEPIPFAAYASTIADHLRCRRALREETIALGRRAAEIGSLERVPSLNLNPPPPTYRPPPYSPPYTPPYTPP